MNICIGLCGLEKHPYKISPGAKPECVGSLRVLFLEGWILAGCCFGAVSLSHSLLASLFHATVSLEVPAQGSLWVWWFSPWPHVCFTLQQSAILPLTQRQMVVHHLQPEFDVMGNKTITIQNHSSLMSPP